jgi:para-aminobenzoate synthetase / 4-amino-4-deoxychorismate lyase
MQKMQLGKLLSDLSSEKNLFFFHTNRLDKDNRYSYLFKSPLEVISCHNLNGIEPSLDKIEKMIKKGFFAAGFLSYEAGFAFEPIFRQKQSYGFPLLWFGIFKKPLIFNHQNIEFIDSNRENNYSINDIKAEVSEKQYINSIEKIKRQIEKGHTYQVNRTFKLNFSHKGSVSSLYMNLVKKQSASYSAFIRFGKQYVLSFSPELFFKKENSLINVKPMKGTIARGRFLKEDIKNIEHLYNCPKNRSENIMILDLLRSDLGRVSKTGTVRTTKLFEIEKYESLFQMTSTAKAEIKQGVALPDLFKAMFPSGSVTGAPKIRTMQIINDIEKSPRRIYTGSIGFITPKKNCVFNVAIRTLLLNSSSGKGEMGIGSGIVYDSDPKKEYQECLLKAKFLTDKYKNFKLIETILWEPVQGYAFIKFHMQRLSESAAYFNYKYDKNYVVKSLNNVSHNFNKGQKYKVRMLLSEDGSLGVKYSMIGKESAGRTIAISSVKTNSEDKWLYHKTTNRHLYDSEYDRYKKLGFFDVIFKNEKDQITEGAISNIFIVRNDVYYTSPIECGVLNGVYRRHLLNGRKIKIKEKPIYQEDLLSADAIVMTNAIRGMVEVSFNFVKKPNINTEYARA